MQRATVQRLSLLAVVLLATVLRVYQLKDLPAGLFCDEAGLGFNAHTIASAGMDENGNHFPLFFWSFGVSYKNPIYIYAAAIPVKLLGLDEFSIRLTSALFGIGTVIGIFFLGRALFNPWVGLFSAVFLTLCPWHLHFSRIAFELISFPFLFVIGATFLVRFTQGQRRLARAMFFFGLCVYAYQIANLFVPLFLLGFGILYLPDLLRRWRESLLAFVVLAATLAPAGVFHYRHQQLSTQYFHNTTNLRPDEAIGPQARRLMLYYQEFFSRSFLLENGDPIGRHSVRGFGELLPIAIPFAIFGAIVALFRRDRASKLILWWLACYPVAPSLMTEIPSASRGIIGVAAFCLLSGIGLAAALRVLGWMAHWRPLALTVQTAALAAVGYLTTIETTAYLHAYFVDYPKYSAWGYGGFQYGYRDVIQYMESERRNYDLLGMTAVEVNQPQIFPLFYNHPDPHEWIAHHDIGYMILDPAEYSRYAMNQRVLYALRPSDLDLFSDYTIKKSVVAPGGQTEFVIAEVRARKRFLTNWLVLGLFANDNGEGVQKEFIDVNHLTKDRYKGAFADIYWRQINPQFVRVDLNRYFAAADPRNPGNPEHVCAYAAMTVNAQRTQDAFLELAGSDDMMQVWLNGRSLTPFAIMLDVAPKRRPIELRAGSNLLVLKSCENVGGWDFTARITDADGKDLSDITPSSDFPANAVPATAPGPPPGTDVQLLSGFDNIVIFKHAADTRPEYRGTSLSWWAQLGDQASELVWRTAPCPEKKRTVFAWTSSVSNESGEADLYVNGTYALTFAMNDVPGIKNWERGPYHMTFVSKASVAGNSGIILLDVPAEQITPGQSVELRVMPVRGKPEAWFMVQNYHDTIDHEHLTPELASDTIRSAWQRQPTHADAPPN
jgi:4-amino-4-deoxy-L-arabinose transferase-like glycosyltransferase